MFSGPIGQVMAHSPLKCGVPWVCVKRPQSTEEPGVHFSVTVPTEREQVNLEEMFP